MTRLIRNVFFTAEPKIIRAFLPFLRALVHKQELCLAEKKRISDKPSHEQIFF